MIYTAVMLGQCDIDITKDDLVNGLIDIMYIWVLVVHKDYKICLLISYSLCLAL